MDTPRPSDPRDGGEDNARLQDANSWPGTAEDTGVRPSSGILTGEGRAVNSTTNSHRRRCR